MKKDRTVEDLLRSLAVTEDHQDSRRTEDPSVDHRRTVSLEAHAVHRRLAGLSAVLHGEVDHLADLRGVVSTADLSVADISAGLHEDDQVAAAIKQ
ncbi:hypothetical protein AAVH_08301 [Aphelenchoides avenae]|nr:hypothetical protein AAVH_08301 [Aphelenchus avenae]